MSGSFEWLVDWDAAVLETGHGLPAGAVGRVLRWDEPGRVDGGPSPRLARLLAGGLCMSGEMAFRWRGASVPGMRPIGHTRRRWFARFRRWPIMAARTPNAAAHLFEEGWALGAQDAVVAASDDQAIALLSERDLRKIGLGGKTVVFSAIVDGTGGLLTAATGADLDAAIAHIDHALVEAGYVDRSRTRYRR